MTWTIEQFVVSQRDAEWGALRGMFRDGRYVPAGIYTKLVRDGKVIMSDTPDELRDLEPLRWALADGNHDVLINGLGLGIAASVALKEPTTRSVTVIEIAQEVIDLVRPRLGSDERLAVICADAYEWKPPKSAQWTIVWHDIWDDICTDNLAGMKRLHRKYGRRARWQGSWCRRLCERGWR